MTLAQLRNQLRDELQRAADLAAFPHETIAANRRVHELVEQIRAAEVENNEGDHQETIVRPFRERVQEINMDAFRQGFGQPAQNQVPAIARAARPVPATDPLTVTTTGRHVMTINWTDIRIGGDAKPQEIDPVREFYAGNTPL